MFRKSKNIIIGGMLVLIMGFISGSKFTYGQASDSTNVIMSSGFGLDSLHRDTNKIIEDAALDIGQDRGCLLLPLTAKYS